MMEQTYNKFGKKLKELINLVETTSDWDKYVDNHTKLLIDDLMQLKNISAITAKNNISYGNLRNKYLIALRRIKEKDNSQMRGAKSKKALYLFELLEKNPNWENCLT